MKDGKFDDVIKYYTNAFKKETTDRRVIIEHNTGFFGVGELIKPRNHIIEGINTIIARSFNINKDGTKIVEHFNYVCTIIE